MEVPQKTKYITYDPAIPLLGIYLDKTFIEKDTCTPIFIAVLFTTAKTWKQPKCPLTDEWIKKMWYIYIQWNITQTLKKKFLSRTLQIGKLERSDTPPIGTGAFPANVCWSLVLIMAEKKPGEGPFFTPGAGTSDSHIK